MQIPPRYQAADVEQKWYDKWLKMNYFHSEPDNREPYTIVIPPPNVTGVLHMGHMLNNTIQDVLIRRARMQGKNACWVPGTDHASIATEAKVVNKLKQEGIDKSDLSREAFMEHAWEWTEKHGGIILEQLKKLGASCDWDRTCFTLDEERSQAVIDTFVELYNKGLIYRGIRMVNWDPEALTAVSDEEVVYREEQSKLYYLNYQIEGEEGHLTIATTRPETILGDTAVCINPKDSRFAHLKGKRVLVPLIQRSIPIVEDEYVDMEFGTGCLKITPAHDIHDYEIGMKHQLDSIDILEDDGSLSPAAGLFVGQDRFEARKNIIPELEKAGNLLKIEDYNNKLGCSERTGAVIEPKLSTQWFLKMTDMAKVALDAVMDEEVKFHPPKFKNVYRHWMENVKDWCISRQLYWGHRIPVYYIQESNDFVVAANAKEALRLAQEKTGDTSLSATDLRQEEDVLDTWASSWLWPISVFNGFDPQNKEIDYYYPTNDLVTGHDIIFFWVARMIMAGYAFKGKAPFRNVYFTGMVRDKQGRKMSKQLGNSPDPIKLMETFGADGVRVGMLLTSPAGNDLPFDESLCEQGRNFTNKIWNALRLVKGWEQADKPQDAAAQQAIAWMENRINASLTAIEDNYSKYRLSDVLMSIYKLIWDDFCSTYLEIVKPPYQQAIDKVSYQATIAIFERLMQILHPFAPFVTEEIWHHLRKRQEGEDIIVSQMPTAAAYDATLLKQFDHISEIVNQIRKLRKEKNIANKESLELYAVGQGLQAYQPLLPIVQKLGNINRIHLDADKPEGMNAQFMALAMEFYIPMQNNVDVEAEREKLHKELQYQQGFLTSVEKKLSNSRFVDNAPAKVVEMEKKKQSDAQEKIAKIEEMLRSLEG